MDWWPSRTFDAGHVGHGFFHIHPMLWWRVWRITTSKSTVQAPNQRFVNLQLAVSSTSLYAAYLRTTGDHQKCSVQCHEDSQCTQIQTALLPLGIPGRLGMPSLRPNERHLNVIQLLTVAQKMGFPQMGGPPNGWFLVGYPIGKDDLGIPYFRKPPYGSWSCSIWYLRWAPTRSRVWRCAPLAQGVEVHRHEQKPIEVQIHPP